MSLSNINSLISDENLSTIDQGGQFEDTVLSLLIDYLTSLNLTYQLSEYSTSPILTFKTDFPLKTFKLPIVVLSVKNIAINQSGMGNIHGTEEYTDRIVRTFKALISVSFEIWANTARERRVIAGLLENALHYGMLNELRDVGFYDARMVYAYSDVFSTTDRTTTNRVTWIDGTDEVFRKSLIFDFNLFKEITDPATDNPNTDYEIAPRIEQINIGLSNEEETLISRIVYASDYTTSQKFRIILS